MINKTKLHQCVICKEDLPLQRRVTQNGREYYQKGVRKYCDTCYATIVIPRWHENSNNKRRERHNLLPKKIVICKKCKKEFLRNKQGAQLYCRECKVIQDRENSLRSSLKYIDANKKAISLINSNLKNGNITVIYECLHDTKKVKHHFDYIKYPLLVLNLCQDCHMKEHKRLRALAIGLSTATRQAQQQSDDLHLRGSLNQTTEYSGGMDCSEEIAPTN